MARAERINRDRWGVPHVEAADVPGVYRFRLKADWEGRVGLMPGLPAEGGAVYVGNGGRGPDIDLPAEPAHHHEHA